MNEIASPCAAADFTVGPLTASVDEVAAIAFEAIAATLPADAPAGIPARTADRSRMVRAVAERTFFEARDTNGALVGVGAVHTPDGIVAHLTIHYVSARGQGIGSALTAARLEWARRQGCTRAVATTHPWNSASLANLARHGFRVTRTEPDQWAAGEIVWLEADLAD